MSEDPKITIALQARDLQAICASMNEYGGGSASTVRRLSGHEDRAVYEVTEVVIAARDSNATHLSLSEKDWRVIYDSINATIYALGPFELHICTGFHPLEMLQTNLNIATHVWGAYGGAKWADYYLIDYASQYASEAR